MHSQHRQRIIDRLSLEAPVALADDPELLAVEVEGVVAVVEVVDHHLDDVLLVDGRDQLRVREGRGAIGGRVAYV